jgi:hypothetical protein
VLTRHVIAIVEAFQKNPLGALLLCLCGWVVVLAIVASRGGEPGCCESCPKPAAGRSAPKTLAAPFVGR